MKVVIAMDSFKGSMTSIEAGDAARKGVLEAMPDAEVVVKPLADGGEGTMETLCQGLGGEMISLAVHDPLGRWTEAMYCMLPQTKSAIIEMAQAAGLTLLEEEERDPYVATTYGVGEMIADAIHRGCREFVIGIGGSATNDGGMGMLQALGYGFLDKNGAELTGGAQSLSEVYEICAENRVQQLSECRFYVACDVKNPLCGKQGATYVYGPQKGLDKKDCAKVDAAMASYADVVEKHTGKQCRNFLGTGAAGGLGFAFVQFLNGELMQGAELVMRLTGFEKNIQDADIFITGEGCADGQSIMGKAPVLAAQKAKKCGCKVYVFAGKLMEGAEQCLEKGVDEMYAITPEEMDYKTAMQKEVACQNMKECVKRVFEREGEKI